MRTNVDAHPLAGKKVWVFPMSNGSARLFAASFRSIGIDAECLPPSDERTRELGARYTCGDECYPMKIVLGEFLKLLEQPGVNPNQTVLFLPTSEGPCRFGQYAPHLKAVLASLGYPGVLVISPNDKNAYSDVGEMASVFVRTGWRALVAGDLLLKFLLKTRPYEVERGSADAVHEQSVREVCAILETPYQSPAEQLAGLRERLLRARNRFRELPVKYDPERPLIGIVGEIFCRLNTFSNDEVVRRLEEHGGEAWMGDVAEWIWYTHFLQLQKLRLAGRRFSLGALGVALRARYQKKDEHELVSLFREDFQGYEEPTDVTTVLRYAEPYLPTLGAEGEMVMNLGKSIYLARKGADGILDISPFTCMNGIISEAIYPRVSRDHAGIPIRTFYFDGTQSDLGRDLGIFLELARSYRAHKPWPRRNPAGFRVSRADSS